MGAGVYTGPMKKDDEKKAWQREVEQEARRDRKTDLAGALGQAAAGNLKGASPVARNQQVLAEIEFLLEAGLRDADGSLRRTILARLQSDPVLLARNLDDPSAALGEFVRKALATDASLRQLVQQADVRWGREFQERPHFEGDTGEPHPDDPYTKAGARRELEALLLHLND